MKKQELQFFGIKIKIKKHKVRFDQKQFLYNFRDT